MTTEGLTRLALSCAPFSLQQLADLIHDASGDPGRNKPVDQVRYLASYLSNKELRAATVLVERPYVDRHWMEEYAGYYATMLEPPAQKAVRLHFFAAKVTKNDFNAAIRELAEGRQDAAQQLQDAYIGYSVIRPLPSAPIGRTVLRPYSGDPRRCFAPAAMVSRVHLAGLSLTVQGLPFQQQDQGVGACATTAIWSALAKVMRNDGQRPPTPLAITKAATEHGVQTRAFPASGGLDLEQMASAIHLSGYQPHLFQVSNRFESFILALGCYLRSGIPVVVRVASGGGTHAMTLVGFRESETLGQDDTVIPLRKKYSLRARGVVRWYVHDDRLGPYARLGLERPDGESTLHNLRLEPLEAGFEHFEDDMSFLDALVPLYPKLRLTAEELVEFALDMLPPLFDLIGDHGAEHLYVEPRFDLGGNYVDAVYALPIATERKVAIVTSMLLSRYVGILSWFLGNEWICDIIYDTTDLRRDMSSAPPILGIIPRREAWLKSLETIRETWLGPRPVIA